MIFIMKLLLNKLLDI